MLRLRGSRVEREADFVRRERADVPSDEPVAEIALRIEVGIADAPRADEMLLVLAMTTGARVHDRAGGLKASQIKGLDGLR